MCNDINVFFYLCIPYFHSIAKNLSYTRFKYSVYFQYNIGLSNLNLQLFLVLNNRAIITNMCITGFINLKTLFNEENKLQILIKY